MILYILNKQVHKRVDKLFVEVIIHRKIYGEGGGGDRKDG